MGYFCAAVSALKSLEQKTRKPFQIYTLLLYTFSILRNFHKTYSQQRRALQLASKYSLACKIRIKLPNISSLLLQALIARRRIFENIFIREARNKRQFLILKKSFFVDNRLEITTSLVSRENGNFNLLKENSERFGFFRNFSLVFFHFFLLCKGTKGFFHNYFSTAFSNVVLYLRSRLATRCNDGNSIAKGTKQAYLYRSVIPCAVKLHNKIKQIVNQKFPDLFCGMRYTSLHTKILACSGPREPSQNIFFTYILLKFNFTRKNVNKKVTLHYTSYNFLPICFSGRTIGVDPSCSK